MTRIDFYSLPDDNEEARDFYACQLTEQAFAQGHSVLIHTEDAEHAQRLDALLWSFRDSSFLPHTLQGQSPAAAIEVGHSGDPGEKHDLLINLAATIPGFFSRFAQVTEIVIEHESARQLSREHYRYYRDHGYPLEHHRIRQRILSQ